MPLQHNNWNDLFREINRKTSVETWKLENISTLVFRHALFLDKEKEEEDAEEFLEEDIPEWFHIMNHVNRSVRYLPLGRNVKSFHSSERTQVVYFISVLIVNNNIIVS